MDAIEEDMKILNLEKDSFTVCDEGFVILVIADVMAIVPLFSDLFFTNN